MLPSLRGLKITPARPLVMVSVRSNEVGDAARRPSTCSPPRSDPSASRRSARDACRCDGVERVSGGRTRLAVGAGTASHDRSGVGIRPGSGGTGPRSARPAPCARSSPSSRSRPRRRRRSSGRPRRCRIGCEVGLVGQDVVGHVARLQLAVDRRAGVDRRESRRGDHRVTDVLPQRVRLRTTVDGPTSRAISTVARSVSVFS